MCGRLVATEEDGSVGAEVWSDSSGLAGVESGADGGYDGCASTSVGPGGWSCYV